MSRSRTLTVREKLMARSLAHCSRCGYPVHSHFDRGRPTGCPPPLLDLKAPPTACQRIGCTAEATDLALALCTEHLPPPIDRTAAQEARVAARLAKGELTLN